MKKLFATLALIAISFPSFGATIHWFSDETDTTTLPSNFVFAVENPGPPQGYRSVRWGTMLKLLGTSTNYLQNLYITSNYVTYLTVQSNITVNGKTTINNDITVVSNAYFNYNITTNLTAISNAYFYQTNFANYTYTTNLFVESNAYFFETNFANYTYTTNLFVESNAYFYETNFVNWNIVTNLQVVSNAYINQIFVNEGHFTNGTVWLEHEWAGPTNDLYVGSTNRYYYTAYTPCSVESLVAWETGYGNSSVLSITNASDSNITISVQAPIRIPYGTTSRDYTLTNGDVWIGSFDVGVMGSNYVGRGFFEP